MAEAAIFTDGKVRQTTNLSDITYNLRTGFVANFTFNTIKYIHVYDNKFKAVDLNAISADVGYYDESVLLNYLADNGAFLDKLRASKLDLSLIANALDEDNVTVKYLKIQSPYSDPCVVVVYNWSFSRLAQVWDDNFNIILQPNHTTTEIKEDLSSVPKAFYANNIPLITSSDFTDDKNSGAYYLTLTTLKIAKVIQDVFPLFYQSDELTAYITTQNLEWQTATDIFIKPSLQDLFDYYTNLSSFYDTLYAKQVTIANASEKTRLFWLAYSLSATGLSVLSVDDKIYIIVQGILMSKQFALINVASTIFNPVTAIPLSATDARWVSSISPQLILKIVESVTLVETQCDDFLDQLNNIGKFGLNKDETLFEVIYNFLGDNQVGNIIGDNKVGRVVGGIFGNSDNRKNFINFLYTIWQTSIYNPYYDSPKYSLPANSDHVFTESYYMTDEGKQNYNPDNATVLFVFEATDTNGDLISFTSFFTFEIERDQIIAYLEEQSDIHDERPSPGSSSKTLYGTYDLYQPVSQIGFQSDLDISMPKANCFPLFFLYYAIDYKDVKDADAAIELVFNLALNFTGIGEAEDLVYLGYLKQISVFNKLQALDASEVVVTWNAVRGVNQAVQFTAGNALAISVFVSQTTTDQRLHDFTTQANYYLGALVLGSVCFNPIVKGRIAIAANKVTVIYDGLITDLKTILTTGGVTKDVIDAIRAFGDDAVATAIVRFSDSASLRNAILKLSDTDMVSFLNTFADISDDFVLKLKQNPDFVNYWDSLSDADKDAFNADKLTNFNTWYDAKVVAEADRRLATGQWIDVRRSNATKRVKLKPEEVQTIVEIDIMFGSECRPSGDSEAGDAVATSGQLKGKSIDAAGRIPKSGLETGWTDYPQESYDGFIKSINTHFAKIVTPVENRPALDIFVLDLKNFDEFDPTIRPRIMDYLNNPTYQYNYLVNSTKFIIIN